MIGPVFEFADLQKISGYERRADVERWAADIQLPVRPCRGGVWTTLEAVHRILGIQPPGVDAPTYGPEVG